MIKETYTYEDGSKLVQIMSQLNLVEAIQNLICLENIDKVIRCEYEVMPDHLKSFCYVRDFVLDRTVCEEDIITIFDAKDSATAIACGNWFEDHMVVFLHHRVSKVIIRDSGVEMYIYK